MPDAYCLSVPHEMPPSNMRCLMTNVWPGILPAWNRRVHEIGMCIKQASCHYVHETCNEASCKSLSAWNRPHASDYPHRDASCLMQVTIHMEMAHNLNTCMRHNLNTFPHLCRVCHQYMPSPLQSVWWIDALTFVECVMRHIAMCHMTHVSHDWLAVPWRCG